MGVAARYVSGYIESYDPNSRLPELVEQSKSHAWLDVYIPSFPGLELIRLTTDILRKHMRNRLGRLYDVSPAREEHSKAQEAVFRS